MSTINIISFYLTLLLFCNSFKLVVAVLYDHVMMFCKNGHYFEKLNVHSQNDQYHLKL